MIPLKNFWWLSRSPPPPHAFIFQTNLSGPPLNPSKVFSDPPFCSPKNQVIPPKILLIVCILLLLFDHPRSPRVYTKTYSGRAILIAVEDIEQPNPISVSKQRALASISLEYIVSILQWSRRLSTMGKFWMSNPMPEQYKAVIPLFLRLVTDRQHTCNSVDKWVFIAFRLPQLHHYIPSRLNFYLFHLKHFTGHCCLLRALRILIWDMYISIVNVTVKSHNKTVWLHEILTVSIWGK